MNAFTKKSLNKPKRVCLCLREAREKKGLSLDDIAHKTKMTKKYVLALEECRFDDLPFSLTYQKHLIKAYAKAISIDPAPFLEQFSTEECLGDEPTPVTAPRTRLTHFLSLPTVARYATLGAVVILCLSYLGWQVHRILKPPELIVYTPIQGYITSNPSLLIQGKTDREVSISINGADTPQHDNGEFGTTVDLSPGVNTITVAVKSKHDKVTTETRHVILRNATEFSAVRDRQNQSSL